MDEGFGSAVIEISYFLLEAQGDYLKWYRALA